MLQYVALVILIVCSYLLHWIPDGASGFPWLMAWACLQGILLFLFIRMRGDRELKLRELIVLFLLVRIPLLSSIPIMENDFWRYLWDGRVLASGLNPYSFPPMASELDVVHIWIRDRVGYGDIGTIYPPFGQVIFAISNLIVGESLIGLKIIFLAFEAMALIGVWSWLTKRKRGHQILWLVFHPLFLKEIVNSAHLDSLAVGTSVMAILALNRSWWQSATWLALAVLSKLWPLVLFPILFFRIPKERRWWATMVFFTIIILFYLPFLDAGSSMWDGTKAFAEYWIFNPGLHHLFLIFFEESFAKVVSALIVLLISLYAAYSFTSERAAVWSIGSLILFSPVINAWYVLWILPFALMANAWPWLVFGVAVFAGYSWFWNQELAFWFRGSQWLLFGVSTIIFLKYKFQKAGEADA